MSRWIIHSPVRVFLQHLVDADAEGLVVIALVDEVFINPKLCSSDRLTLWDPWQVKSELFMMPSHWEELFVMLHCKTQIKRVNELD